MWTGSGTPSTPPVVFLDRLDTTSTTGVQSSRVQSSSHCYTSSGRVWKSHMLYTEDEVKVKGSTCVLQDPPVITDLSLPFPLRHFGSESTQFNYVVFRSFYHLLFFVCSFLLGFKNTYELIFLPLLRSSTTFCYHSNQDDIRNRTYIFVDRPLTSEFLSCSDLYFCILKNWFTPKHVKR